jgi:hypothetical protein
MTQPWSSAPRVPGRPEPANLADILERVLDKGIVVAGDIRVNLLDIELLTIRLRLLIASVDRAREMGIDWWEHDPTLSSGKGGLADGGGDARARAIPADRKAADPAGRQIRTRRSRPGQDKDDSQ